MKKRIKVSIHGRVQGVWFRASTQKEAVSLGLNGFVAADLTNIPLSDSMVLAYSTMEWNVLALEVTQQAGVTHFNLQVRGVPLPAAIWLLLIGGFGLVWQRRRRVNCHPRGVTPACRGCARSQLPDVPRQPQPAGRSG